VLKKELLAIPFWGWCAAKSGSIGVDRSAGASALKAMVRDVEDELARGTPIVIFPEGTRTEPGKRGTYHPGIAALYARTKAPVVPVALNSGVFWGRREFLKRPGTMILEFLPPLPAGLDRRTFMAELERRIEQASDKLVAEARGEAGS
jgi:1-acyl-sn-glycerol-3-phosphate acyltransferase